MEGKGVKRCLCVKRDIHRAALRCIPVEYFGKPKLARLVPQPERHPLQRDVIALIRKHPDESYLFCGDNGKGKTHFAFALYRHALAKGRPVVYRLLQELLTEFRIYELQVGKSYDELTDDEKKQRPVVLPSDLKQSNRRWTILLDDFDKARPTEFASEQLFCLLDAARNFGHQLLITTNKRPAELRALWSRIDGVWGNSIMKCLESCNVIQMF
ncbi:MAG: hypothetical protein AB1631_30650 [Acidobacteriota bacterium]